MEIRGIMAKATDKPIVLVDGSSYLYRAFHALPPLTTSKGQPTGAIYGVINMLRKLLTDYQPDKIIVVFDAKGKTFRDELYEEYKANRPPMPDDLQDQIEPLHEAIEAMGIPLVMVEGVEADDVIGTLSREACAEGYHVVISTSDKDMAQLVNKQITLINTMSNKKYDEAGVKEKFGVTPKQIIDYLTLVGDTSDNVPGVPKCGPKTAAKWLNEYQSLQNIVKNANDIKGKVGEYLRESIPDFPLMNELVTIKQDVPLKLKLKDLDLKEKETDKLIQIFTHLEFKGWLSELLNKQEESDGKSAAQKAEDEGAYKIILKEADFEKLIKSLEKEKLVAFDTETTSLDYMQAELVGFSFAVKEGEAVYIPVGHNYPGAPKQLDLKDVLAKLKPILESTEILKVGHHLKYDKNVLENYDIHLQGIGFDSMLESYVLNSTASRHDMDTLALKYLGYKTISYEDVAGKGAKQINFSEVAIEVAGPYAAEDADISLRLHKELWPKIKTQPGLLATFQETEMPLLSILSKIERAGVLVDEKLLKEQSKELAARIEKLEKKAYKEAGEEFNLASPKQLQAILFEKLNLPVLSKTPSGQPSTAEDVLQDLAADYILPEVILEYRSLSKLKSTYTDRLPERINPTTGRIHTSYHQAVAATGRLSSSDPNLQNIPVRTEEGRRIRQAFIAPPGYEIVSADYSQVELRIMAHISKDPGMLSAFEKELDIHKATASEILNVPYEKVTDEQRRSVKAVNFGLIYGMSAFGLAKQLGIDRKTAQGFIDTYFKRYPKVKDYMEKTRKSAHELGYVETIFGRRLYIPEINTKNHQRQKAAERAAINGPLQGTAADIIKRAMILMDDWLQRTDIDARMIMQVHDELVFEVADGSVEALIVGVEDSMTQAAKLKVPLIVATGVGKNWDEAH